jgi:hypothetical protein
MNVAVFERMIGRAQYKFVRIYQGANGERRYVYKSGTRPLINVEVVDDEVDDYDALKIEAWLDEEGWLEEDED